MTYWTVESVEELISQIEKEVERISNLSMNHNYDKGIIISRNLYEKLKND